MATAVYSSTTYMYSVKKIAVKKIAAGGGGGGKLVVVDGRERARTRT